MKTKQVLDLPPRKVVVQTNQEFYSIPPIPFTHLDLSQAENLIQSPVEAPKKKRRPRKQPLSPIYSIDCEEENYVDKEENLEMIRRKRRRMGKDRLVFDRQTETECTFMPTIVMPKRRSKCDLRSNVLIKNASRNMMLINNAVRNCQKPEIRTRSESVNPTEIPPLSNPSPPKAVQIELFPQSACRTAGYRKVTFGDHTVINSVIPTIIINDDDEFDMFNTPNLKSLPDNIFEPIIVKEENEIINEDVLINTNSPSVFTSDSSMSEDELLITKLHNHRVSLLKNGKNDADLDERVETLRNINAVSSVPINTKDTADNKDTIPNSNIENEVILKENSQKSLLESLNLQIQLLEDIVYGSAQKNHSSSSIEATLDENSSESVRSVETDGQTPNTSIKSESDDVDINTTPNVAAATENSDDTTPSQREILNPVKPEFEETERELSTISEVNENQEILSKDDIAEILYDPFANTFGKPDEVIITSENSELDTKTDEVTVQLQTQFENLGDDGRCVKKKNEAIRTMKEHIRQIIREEAGRDEVTVTVCEEELRRIETKKKIAALQKIYSYLHDIIESEDSTKEVAEVGFVEKLIDSTLNLYTLRKNHNESKKRVKGWKSLRKFKKLLSIAHLQSKGTRLKTLKQLIKIFRAPQRLKRDQNKSKQNDERGKDIVDSKCIEEIDIKTQTFADHHYTNTIEDQSLFVELTHFSDLGKDKENENSCLLFSEMEDIIGTNPMKVELIYDENKVVEELSAVSEYSIINELDICDIKVGESSKTYSRKASKNRIEEESDNPRPKKVLANLENIEPDPKVKLEEPKKSKLANKKPTVEVSHSSENIPCVIDVDENQNDLTNVCIKRKPIMTRKMKKELIEPERPVRRASIRTRKRPNFYGNVCQFEKKKPNRPTQTKVKLQ